MATVGTQNLHTESSPASAKKQNTTFPQDFVLAGKTVFFYQIDGNASRHPPRF